MRRLNWLGVSRCRLIKVEFLDLHVEELDAVNGTPVLDIKPWFHEFGPRGTVAPSGRPHGRAKCSPSISQHRHTTHEPQRQRAEHFLGCAARHDDAPLSDPGADTGQHDIRAYRPRHRRLRATSLPRIVQPVYLAAHKITDFKWP
jgi:hypothetical protein